jgi:chromosome segregation ATPase
VEAERAVARAREEAVQGDRALSEAEESLAVAVGALVADTRGPTLEARIVEALRDLAAQRAQHERAAAARQRAEAELQASRHEAVRATERAEDLARQADAASRRATEDQREVSRLDAEIGRVTEDPDPLAERDRVLAEHDRLVGELDTARQDERLAANDLAAADAAHAAARRAADEAAEAARDALEHLRRHARAAGFPDEAAARAASLDPREIGRLAQEIETHRRDRHALERRVAELTSELGGRQVTEREVAEATRCADERQGAVEDLQRRSAQVERDIEELAKRVERAQMLAQELRTARTDHTLQRRLAEDLQSQRFQAFVLQETFRELAAGASERGRGPIAVEKGKGAFFR